MSPDQIAGLVASLVVAIGSITGWLAWARPRLKARRDRERRKDFALLGGDLIDPLTGKKVGEQPPLGQWMASSSELMTNTNRNLEATNRNLQKLTELVSTQVHAQLSDHETRITTGEKERAQIQRDMDEFKKARDERIAAHLDSAYMLKLAADGNDPDLAPRPVEAEQIDPDDPTE